MAVRICKKYHFDFSADFQGEVVAQIVHVLILKTIDIFFKNGALPNDCQGFLTSELSNAKSLTTSDKGFSTATGIVEILLSEGDLLLYPSDLDHFKSISMKLAILIAVLSFSECGINFWGVHYENSFND